MVSTVIHVYIMFRNFGWEVQSKIMLHLFIKIKQEVKFGYEHTIVPLVPL